MKRIIICIAIVFVYTQWCIGQTSMISKLDYYPKPVTADDTIKIKYHYLFSSYPCQKDSFNVSIKDTVVTINAYYTVGTATTLCGGNDSITLNKLLPQKYKVVVKIYRNNKYSCSDSISLLVDKRNAIEALYSVNLKIYPNPAKNTLFYRGLEYKSTISIIDARGHTRKTIETGNDQGEIDVSDLEPGVFLIRVEQNDKISDYKVVLSR